MTNPHADLIAQLKRYNDCKTDWVDASAIIAALSAPVTLAQAMQCPDVQAMVEAFIPFVDGVMSAENRKRGVAALAPILALSANNERKDNAD